MISLFGRATILAFVMMLAVAPTGASLAAETGEEALSLDGLEAVKIKGLDLAYVRPGASLTPYNAILLDPVVVSFHKDWNPRVAGSAFKLNASERDRIRSRLADLVREEFVKGLGKNEGYRLATTPGPDVLRVRLNIVDLYVNAPDVPTAGRVRTYTLSAGEMTLLAELYDSETGSVIARVVDRRQARETDRLMLSNSITNRAAAREIAASWARIFRKSLDSAKAGE